MVATTRPFERVTDPIPTRKGRIVASWIAAERVRSCSMGWPSWKIVQSPSFSVTAYCTMRARVPTRLGA